MTISATDPAAGLHTSNIDSLPLIHSGKVRDIYAVGDDHLLILTSDRISAYDVILPTAIPGKGLLLTELALFWFRRVEHLVPNHLSDLRLEDILSDAEERRQAEGRSMLVRKLAGIPAEAVVRGYLIGSGWRDYQRTGSICGIELSPGLAIASQLETPVFTPATKAAVGDHDENISFEEMCTLTDPETANRMRDISLQIYREASQYAQACGIIIADTKFEFGLDANGTLTLMDEILTPDSSRFWPAAEWQPGRNPASFDKQYLRDYLDTLDWNKQAPGPVLPETVVAGIRARYEDARQRLMRG